MGAESEERPKQVVCYRARMRLGGGGGGELDLEDGGRGGDLQSVYLLSWLQWHAGAQGMRVGVGGWDKVGGREFGEADQCDLFKRGGLGEGGFSRCSARNWG